MSREDFEQFRKHLENRPEPNFDQSLWLKLEQDLDPHSKRNNYLLVLPSLLLMLLLLGSNGYWFWTFRQYQQKQSGLPGTLILQDTIYKSHVYYEYDTIRQTVYWQNEVHQNATPQPFRAVPFTFRQLDMDPQANNTLPYLSVLEKQPKQDVFPGFLLPFTFSENQYPISHTTKDNPSFTQTSLLKCNSLLHPLWPFEMDSSIVLSTELAEVEREKKRKKCFSCLEQLKPTGLQLAAKAGASYPYNHSTIDLGTKGELEVLIDFRSPVQVWINAAWHRNHFLSEGMDASQGVPPLQPPAEEFVFSEAESTLQSLHFSLGLQYQFGLGTKHNMRGHLGIGIGNTILMPYELAYDFSIPNTDIEVSTEEFVRPISTQQRNMLFRLGLSMPLRKRWDVLLQSNWRRHWGTDNWQAPDLLDIQTGLIYRF